MTKPLSVQLYSLREYTGKDLPAVLKKVADIGYKGVEPAGFFNLRPSEFKHMCDDLGLTIYSAHSPWARPQSLGEAMELADLLGLKRIVCGYQASDFADLDSIKRAAETTNQMQTFLARNGFMLFQHNHAFEFDRLDGKLKYDIYAELCPDVQFQIDCFWSANAGAENAVEMLKRFADRTVLIHMKDGLLPSSPAAPTSPGAPKAKADLRPLGSGDLDIPGLVEVMPDQVETITVELDYCDIDMWTAITDSYHYMTENKLAAGNR